MLKCVSSGCRRDTEWGRRHLNLGCCILFCIYFYSCSTFYQWWMYRDTQWLFVPVLSPEHTVLQWPCKPRTSGDHGPLLEYHLHALCAYPPACALDRCFPVIPVNNEHCWTCSNTLTLCTPAPGSACHAPGRLFPWVLFTWTPWFQFSSESPAPTLSVHTGLGTLSSCCFSFCFPSWHGLTLT